MAKKKKQTTSTPSTMKDVAELAGVSISTVSRMLNDVTSAFPISDATRKTIEDAIETLDYRPNQIARSLRTQRTQMIAVMIGDISNAFYHPIVRVIQDIAGVRDYGVLISNSDHLYENERRFFDGILRRPVDGIIIALHRMETEELNSHITRCGIPVVAIGSQVEHPLVDVFGGTSEPATYEAITWLIKEKGHRRIGCIGVAEDMAPGPARVRGYERALLDFGLEVDPQLIQKVEFSQDGGEQAMHSFLALENPPTAIFTCNSMMAIGAIQVVQSAGYRVPEDFSFIGFDDIPEAQIIRPKLTVVARDLHEIGLQVTNMLFERIDGKVKDKGRFVQGDWTLIDRDSVATLG